MFGWSRRRDPRGTRRVKKTAGNQFLIAPAPNRPIDFQNARLFERGATSSPAVISYGTRDGTYDAYSDRLRASCDAHGVAHSIETIPPCGWENACMFKPSFIKFKLLTLNRPLVWLDADAVLQDSFELPDGDWDIGTLPNNRTSSINQKGSVCLCFRPTLAALRLIETWEQFCSTFWVGEGVDHSRLNYTLQVLSGTYTEVDVSPVFSGVLVRDLGKKKEHAF